MNEYISPEEMCYELSSITKENWFTILKELTLTELENYYYSLIE
jgi:hypothetical protein